MDNPEIMQRARRARDMLADRFINHPAVTLIGIGLSPTTETTTGTSGIVLKIHVRPDWAESQPDLHTVFPAEIDGFPVLVIPGEYHLDSNSQVSVDE